MREEIVKAYRFCEVFWIKEHFFFKYPSLNSFRRIILIFIIIMYLVSRVWVSQASRTVQLSTTSVIFYNCPVAMSKIIRL